MTPQQARALDFIRDYRALRGISPTYQEIAEAVGLIGKAGGHRLVAALVEQGRVRLIPHKARGIELVDAVDLIAVPTDALRAELARRGVTMDALMTPRVIGPSATPRCAHNHCAEMVERGQMFCRAHWYALSHDRQRAITEAFGRRDPAAFEAAVRAARDALTRMARVAA